MPDADVVQGATEGCMYLIQGTNERTHERMNERMKE